MRGAIFVSVSSRQSRYVDEGGECDVGRMGHWRDLGGIVDAARMNWHKTRLLRGRFELGDEELLAGDSRGGKTSKVGFSHG